MHIRSNIMGVDVGSVAVSLAEIGPEKELLQTAYAFHHGKIAECLRKMLADFDISRIGGIAATASTPPIVRVHRHYDGRVSVIEACRHFHGTVGAILVVGGERFGLIRFDEHGDYLSFKANSSCAAGTGSFLDQQAGRLGLSGIAELSRIASANTGAIPKIASRCAVFAKTDLVYAQQEGYSLAGICDGLCYGLAENIVDVLFKDRETNGPVIFAGGVSKNRAVADHIRALTGLEIVQGEHGAVYGAVGAALHLADELHEVERLPIRSVDDILMEQPKAKHYFHEPLDLKLSDYPDFAGTEAYEFSADSLPSAYPVEVDIYQRPEPDQPTKIWLGLDIGSTSTKAVLMDRDKAVLAGFYTRTAGRPVDAVLQLFAAIEDMTRRTGANLQIMGAGTTGSGRKFAGKIIGADLIIDEITAHARAACELNPETDTIIEIGGQDSKFTTLKEGHVTFSVMNTVCAAGTGSFIEEQARKLGCPLCDYSARTEGRPSPIASDRCTVFMERDINHHLSEGYGVDEVLASVLHSIRENYLTKVAVESSIGESISFQGATAKNRALVAAFEQRLGKPIHVSRYCHLTGALGVALMLREQSITKTGFRGLGLYQHPIPVRSEVCDLCPNHCKITVAQVDGHDVAYGFLCGRDYDTKKYVNNNRSGFDLLRERKRAFAFRWPEQYDKPFTVGIPAALYLHEDLPVWQKFFDELSIRTVTSEGYKEAIREGKRIAGAEFCAPMAALHGHADYLRDKADYIFLPVYLEQKADRKEVRRQYCYYSQYAAALASGAGGREKPRFLMPLVSYLYTHFYAKVQIYQSLKSIPGSGISFMAVSGAYDRAFAFREESFEKLKALYRQKVPADDIHVVFLGRPYSVLSGGMNKGIPNIFAALGVKTFFQDMLAYGEDEVRAIRPLADELAWHYAPQILEAAEVVAKREGAYPAFVTSFKCTPDAFAVPYFKKLMEAHGKPYLILQLDEHDSSVGYETRIEAAIRSFRNHHMAGAARRSAPYGPWLIPRQESYVADKTLLIPDWDNLSLPLIVANLRKEGIDARLLKEDEKCIRQSLRHNTGQCIPMNIIAQEFTDYVRGHGLDPAKTVLWVPASSLACNLCMFSHHIRTLLNDYGKGMEKAGVYKGLASFMDISVKFSVNSYFAYMFGGLLRRLGCKIRPYEQHPGETDAVLRESLAIFTDAFSGNRSKEEAVAKVVSRFEQIAVSHEERPKVAIFGDLYVRDNDVMNQGLVRYIEANGGEVITTPYSSYTKMIIGQYLRKWFIEGKYMDVVSSKALIMALRQMEKTYAGYFERILGPEPVYDEPPEKILSRYNIRIENTGESMDNILKIFYLLKHYPDISLFVLTSPAFCCPSLVTEAMAGQIGKNTGVSVVSVTYDGTGSCKNDVIIPYLRYPRKSVRREGLRKAL